MTAQRPAPVRVLWFATSEEADTFAASRVSVAIVEPAFWGAGFVVMVW